jgi:hypothetical protein
MLLLLIEFVATFMDAADLSLGVKYFVSHPNKLVNADTRWIVYVAARCLQAAVPKVGCGSLDRTLY